MRHRRISVRGIDLAYFEWGDPGARGPGGETLVMLHATGFHARCWDGVIRTLGDGFHVVCPDLRGHGRSTKRGPYEWDEFGADAGAFVDALGLDRVIGVGHSMGGHAIVQAAAMHPQRFRALLLVDPVILHPDAYARQPSFVARELHPVGRRRNRWRSAEEMFERFADRHPFRLWDRQVLMDYCQHGLNQERDGEELVLGCPPWVEASIYAGTTGRDIHKTIRTLAHPVVVLRAHRQRQDQQSTPTDFAQSPTWEGLASAFPNGRDVHYPELTHFIPMQRPDLVASQIRGLIQSTSVHQPS